MQEGKKIFRNMGLDKYFLPLRPYEGFGPGPIKKEIVQAIKEAGFEYMFSKADFNALPKIQYIDDKFISMNYTAGQWDGWTPFETINSAWDLRKAEKKILKHGKPGWIVGTIDTCQWTFSGEFWKRATGLYDIASLISRGGDSGKLINVKPITISQYARILKEGNF